MRGKITDNLKPALMKGHCNVDYWKLNGMAGSSKCLRQKHQFLTFWGKTICGNYDKRANSKCDRGVANRWNHIRKRRVTVNGWESWYLLQWFTERQ